MVIVTFDAKLAFINESILPLQNIAESIVALYNTFNYEEICRHLLLLLDMAKLAAETIMLTHFPLI